MKERKQSYFKKIGNSLPKIVDKNIKENYNRDLLNNGKWLILYHSHNCPHCVDMMPEWQKFKDSKPEINVLEIEREAMPPKQKQKWRSVNRSRVADGEKRGNRAAESGKT